MVWVYTNGAPPIPFKPGRHEGTGFKVFETTRVALTVWFEAEAVLPDVSKASPISR